MKKSLAPMFTINNINGLLKNPQTRDVLDRISASDISLSILPDPNAAVVISPHQNKYLSIAIANDNTDVDGSYNNPQEMQFLSHTLLDSNNDTTEFEKERLRAIAALAKEVAAANALLEQSKEKEIIPVPERKTSTTPLLGTFKTCYTAAGLVDAKKYNAQCDFIESMGGEKC